MRPWEADAVFGRVFLAAASIHAGGNVIAFAALYLMTHGGGDGKVDSPAIEAVFTLLQCLSFPLAWGVQMLIDPGWHDGPAFWVGLVLRLANSLLIGLAVAWVWTSRRGARHS